MAEHPETTRFSQQTIEILEQRQECSAIRFLGGDPLFISRPRGGVMAVFRNGKNPTVRVVSGKPYDPRPTEIYVLTRGEIHGIELDATPLEIQPEDIKDDSGTLLFITNHREEDPAVLAVNAIARNIRYRANKILVGMLELMTGASCEVEMGDEGSILLRAASNYPIARILRRGKDVFLKSLDSNREVLLETEEILVGVDHQDRKFFPPASTPHISSTHAKIEIRRETNGRIVLEITDLKGAYRTEVTIEEKIEQSSFGNVQIERGTTDRIREIAPDEEFMEMAVCNDVDGQVFYPQARMFGFTHVAGKMDGINQDGVYINPKCRIMAGGDGISLCPFGELACSLALASVHQDVKAGIGTEQMAVRACDFLKRYFQREDVVAHFRSGKSSGTTFGVVQEKTSSSGKRLGGFIVGDYKAFVIDVTNRRIVYESKEQNAFEDMVAKGLRTRDDERAKRMFENWVTNDITSSSQGLSREPEYFDIPVPKGHTYVTLLMSDGISKIMPPLEILRFVAEHGDQAWSHIANEARHRETPDNISVCQMVTEG